MAKVTFKGSEVNTNGELPTKGELAPEFTLVKNDLSEISLKDLKGKNIVLNIFPSLDTEVCAASVRRFNKEAASLVNTIILAISADLPFAATRFCTTEGIENVIPTSIFRNAEFARNYGVLMNDGPLKGLLARSVIIVNPEGKIIYTQLVSEITEEPDYQAAIDVIK
ncbi:thiol peroxidase [Parabacteroides sp. PF5-5]|uniref:thiol peroxidase n=1 Tax=Bacteroidales TaxID=171549 RepID=UPI000381D522|nr:MULTISPECIES: thiol peroxidase [Bacteroidales]EOA56144.1 thiol peroxidase, atypical 2-Cys peroxiredoxin [Bacteroides sp. HPS0048]MDH6304005.1 thiol peroxidase [Parabacteroides sp. PH5-39]MDH6315280.1 thiol peroxidase [Parabacteroides sp. PF5-13]MDH6318940.1 thiol peroxidase [Parabacteroides sp. PH5-13]MDH6322669.1 thiol peroxidase [Parabacteroides sp. PH5-8]